MRMNEVNGKKIIIFDGICNLCSWSVRFIIRHDKKEVFRFVPFQNEMARRLTGGLDLKFEKNATILLITDEKVYEGSDAFFEILRHLDGAWKYLRVLKIFPKKLREYFYRLIAGNRYRIFGRKNVCMIPGEEIRERFLK